MVKHIGDLPPICQFNRKQILITHIFQYTLLKNADTRFEIPGITADQHNLIYFFIELN